MSQSPLAEQMLDDFWRMLTADRSKLEAFADDPGFRQAFVSAHEALGDSLAVVLRRHAFLLLQPDCLTKRMAGRCLTFVEQHGFRPVHAARVHLGPAVVDSLWFYQSESATPDSNTISKLVCGRSDSLLVVLRDEAPEPEVPASLRLTRLKGPAWPERRTAGQLRTVIEAQGPLVVLVHTSDEPLDMIREAAVICGPATGDLYAALTGPIPDDARAWLIAHIEALYGETDAHDLDPAAAMARLGDALTAASHDARHASAAQRLLSTLAVIRAGDALLDWQPFADDLHRIGIDPAGWDSVLVGSRYIQLDLADVPRRFAVVHPDPAAQTPVGPGGAP
ncbi:nucleoside-diphosphate kinase [Micromonospora aurantiaca (nom. illeg.)]|uniref:nucleoside-diphosphate kinase n=1 Tax=Micromonospora aurantiaca (nom. illeg.) TaxID=47850 RepID=UPI0014774800|nr:nucleoside-diphosphate kinase [Micromonospora aurantiaca]